MHLHPLHQIPAEIQRPAPNGADALEPLLNKLRFLAGRCRSAARLDLFQACQTLSSHPTTAATAYATAIFRTLPQAIGRPPVFYAPGTPQRSFDEDWLVRLLDRARAQDHDSFAFLISRRVAKPKRLALAALVRGLADRLPEL